MAKVLTGDVLAKDTLTEQDIKLICKRLNAGEKITFPEKVYKLTSEQNIKGFTWLYDLWKTPKGLERKTNPFGYREQEALNEFSAFELQEFYNAGNYHTNWYVPLYNVVSKNAGGTYTGFQYYVAGGKPVIIG